MRCIQTTRRREIERYIDKKNISKQDKVYWKTKNGNYLKINFQSGTRKE
jgi:hypothetical protein